MMKSSSEGESMLESLGGLHYFSFVKGVKYSRKCEAAL